MKVCVGKSKYTHTQKCQVNAISWGNAESGALDTGKHVGFELDKLLYTRA